VSVDGQQLAATAERLRAEESVPGLLGATARAYVELFDAQACTISRVIGDLLVDLFQHDRTNKPVRLGHGYLISDYPVTRAVIEEREPRTVSKEDPGADANEVKLLEELGFASLLMVALETDEGAWGLIEVYGVGSRSFSDEESRTAQQLALDVGVILQQLERRS
jgi:GAF domain-containing protein